jgi:hypothetical protein
VVAIANRPPHFTRSRLKARCRQRHTGARTTLEPINRVCCVHQAWPLIVSAAVQANRLAARVEFLYVPAEHAAGAGRARPGPPAPLSRDNCARHRHGTSSNMDARRRPVVHGHRHRPDRHPPRRDDGDASKRRFVQQLASSNYRAAAYYVAGIR